MADIKVRLQVPSDLNPDNIVIRVQGTQDEPLFHLGDLCRVLGHTNPSKVGERLDDDEKAIRIVYTLRGLQKALFVTESGFYSVILTSRAANARDFKRWVTGNVLPSIRRHGCYPAPQNEIKVETISLRPYTKRVMQLPDVRRNLPPEHFCVFTEASDLLIWAECVFLPAGLEMQQYDLLDGSVGTRYAQYREGKSWAGQRITYLHQFPEGDPRGVQEAAAYPMSELQFFREWLHSTYIPIHFIDYLTRKYGKTRILRAAPTLKRLGLNTAALPAAKVKKTK